MSDPKKTVLERRLSALATPEQRHLLQAVANGGVDTESAGETTDLLALAQAGFIYPTQALDGQRYEFDRVEAQEFASWLQMLLDRPEA